MVSFPMPEGRPRAQSVAKRFESDARALVPVSDEIGGIVMYLNGQPAYYVLNGEWFEAIDGPGQRSCAEISEEKPQGDRLAGPASVAAHDEGDTTHDDSLSTS